MTMECHAWKSAVSKRHGCILTAKCFSTPLVAPSDNACSRRKSQRGKPFVEKLSPLSSCQCCPQMLSNTSCVSWRPLFCRMPNALAAAVRERQYPIHCQVLLLWTTHASFLRLSPWRLICKVQHCQTLVRKPLCHQAGPPTHHALPVLPSYHVSSTSARGRVQSETTLQCLDPTSAACSGELQNRQHVLPNSAPLILSMVKLGRPSLSAQLRPARRALTIAARRSNMSAMLWRPLTPSMAKYSITYSWSGHSASGSIANGNWLTHLDSFNQR